MAEIGKRGSLGFFLVFLLVMLLVNGLAIEYVFGIQEELAYDDGIPEYSTWWSGAGGIFAVRFTPSISGLLRRCAFFITANPAPVKIHVMDSDKNDVITPFTFDVAYTEWINVNLLPYEVPVSSGVDFYVGLEWTEANAPYLGYDTTDPDDRSWSFNGAAWSLRSTRDYLIRATVGDEGEADIDVNPTHLDFYDGNSGSASTSAGELFSLREKEEVCSVMRLDEASLDEWVESYTSAPRADVRSESIPLTSSFSLLNHLEYDPSERDQGDCGNCWVWAGTGIMEVALDAQEQIKDRLSVQYFTSCWHGGVPNDWACCGGNLAEFADWYQDNMFAVPWSNTNASWQDMNRNCTEGTSVPGNTISISPNYALTGCTAETVETHDAGQTQAIDNIKSILGQDRAIYFSFALPSDADWNTFFGFWLNEAESAVFSFDYSNGHTWVEDEGAGHAVLCVGYNDTDPENSYWIMLNSWGTTVGRPNGIFHLNMDMNYDCFLYGVGYSLGWQTLDVDFASDSQAVVVSNVGNDFLEVSSIEFDQPWLSVLEPSSPSFEVAPGEKQPVLVHVDKSGLDAGVYYGNGDINSNDLDENPVTFTVTLKVGSSFSFDFGTDSSPVEADYTQVTEFTLYLVGSGYGWTSTSGLASRDRGAPDDLNRDLVQSVAENTFKLDLMSGDYQIAMIMGDQSYMHDLIDVYAEDIQEINDLTATAGEFQEVVFYATVSDGQLNLRIRDDGGSDGNWVINALTVQPGTPPRLPTEGYFDFGTVVSPVEDGYVQVTETTLYSALTGYGWTNTVGLSSRNRGAPDILNGDLVQSTTEHTFSVDLANGDYEVTVIIGDQSYMHDVINVYAEDVLKIDDLIAFAGTFQEVTFYITLTDEQLNLKIRDDGGSDPNWLINALTIQPGTPPPLPTEAYFDFGTGSSPLEEGFTQITETTFYSDAAGYGWSSTIGLESRDRGSPDNLSRDLVQSVIEHTFSVNLADGDYMITVVIGDQSYSHDNIDVYAEDLLKINDFTAVAGTFQEVILYTTITDGQLNLRILDDGGSDGNWVINSMAVQPGTPPTEGRFDFGTDSSPLETGYTRVSRSTSYSSGLGYGWGSTVNLMSRDRGAPDDLKRDFIQSVTESIFNVDLANGDYQVTIVTGDQSYMHDLIDVYAEDIIVIDDLTASAGSFQEVAFWVSVLDGQLNLRIRDDGGADPNWVLNVIIVEPISP